MANFMPHEHQASRLKFIFENHFSFSITTYVVGSQEKRLIECEVVKALLIVLSCLAIIILVKGAGCFLVSGGSRISGINVLGRIVDFISKF